jgi:hypothetical protein
MVAGVPPGAFGILSLGYTTDIFDGSMPANPMSFLVPPGPVDLMGSRVVNPGGAPDKLLLMRNLNFPNGGSVPAPIDFNGPSSFAPATANVTITGATAGESLETFVDLVTANGIGALWSGLAPSPATTRVWAGLPSAVTLTTDYHALTVFSTLTASPLDVRVTLRFVGPVSNQTLALGPPLSAPTASLVAAGEYPRFRFQGTLPAEYNRGFSFTVFSNQGLDNFFTIAGTSGYLAAAGNALTYNITMPDIASVAGFPLAARVRPGGNVVIVNAYGFNAPGIFDPTPVLGTEFKLASRTLLIIVP